MPCIIFIKSSSYTAGIPTQMTVGTTVLNYLTSTDIPDYTDIPEYATVCFYPLQILINMMFVDFNYLSKKIKGAS